MGLISAKMRFDSLLEEDIKQVKQYMCLDQAIKWNSEGQCKCVFVLK